MSDLVIVLRKVIATFGTRSGGVKVGLLICREWFHVQGIGHYFTDDLVFVENNVVVEVVHDVFPAAHDRWGLILFVLGYAITRESTPVSYTHLTLPTILRV